jgi:hypothetical protein
MTLIIPSTTNQPDVHLHVSITGTDPTIPLAGTPECGALRVDDDHHAVARIQDGPLVIDTDDLDTALAYRNAWQQVVSHLIVHRDYQNKRRAAQTESETQA